MKQWVVLLECRCIVQVTHHAAICISQSAAVCHMRRCAPNVVLPCKPLHILSIFVCHSHGIHTVVDKCTVNRQVHHRCLGCCGRQCLEPLPLAQLMFRRCS